MLSKYVCLMIFSSLGQHVYIECISQMQSASEPDIREFINYNLPGP